MHPSSFAAALLALSTLYVPDATAVEADRSYLSHGVANCQSALPVFDGLIRKRPKAVANEGNSTAFITCDFEQIPDALASVKLVAIYFINRNAGAVAVTCTLVQGFGDDSFAPPAIIKSMQLKPGALIPLVWSVSDNSDSNFTAPAASCQLQPGVEIGATQLRFREPSGV